MKRRSLSLDEQILYDECHREWEITTHKGLSKCRIIKFTPSTKKHYVKFYSDNGHPIRVSVGNDVAKKHCWMLDLMELSEQQLIDLEQFAVVKVDNEWMVEVCHLFFLHSFHNVSSDLLL